MGNPIRSALVGLGYTAIAGGIRLPEIKLLSEFRQWSCLVDLIRKLDINVFLDVGANRGFFSKHLRMSGYKGRLYSFEPIPADQDQIQKLAKDDPNWTVCGYALGAESGKKDFHINLSAGETVLSSFLPFKGGNGRVQTIPVNVRRLDEVLPEIIGTAPNPRIFLKMDTQGFDRQVLDGSGAYLSRILGIQSEISVLPLYENMTHYTDALASYEAMGFRLVDLFVVNRAADGQIVEYDCIMTRMSKENIGKA